MLTCWYNSILSKRYYVRYRSRGSSHHFLANSFYFSHKRGKETADIGKQWLEDDSWRVCFAAVWQCDGPNWWVWFTCCLCGGGSNRCTSCSRKAGGFFGRSGGEGVFFFGVLLGSLRLGRFCICRRCLLAFLCSACFLLLRPSFVGQDFGFFLY